LPAPERRRMEDMGCSLLPKTRQVYRDINELLTFLSETPNPSISQQLQEFEIDAVSLDGAAESPASNCTTVQNDPPAPKCGVAVQAASLDEAWQVMIEQLSTGVLARAMKLQDVQLLVDGLGGSNQLMLEAQTQTLLQWLQMENRTSDDVMQLPNLRNVLTNKVTNHMHGLHYTLKEGTIKLVTQLAEAAISSGELFEPLMSALFGNIQERGDSSQYSVSDDVLRAFLAAIMEPVHCWATSVGWRGQLQSWREYIVSQLIQKPYNRIAAPHLAKILASWEIETNAEQAVLFAHFRSLVNWEDSMNLPLYLKLSPDLRLCVAMAFLPKLHMQCFDTVLCSHLANELSAKEEGHEEGPSARLQFTL